MTNFESLGLIQPILDALATNGYEQPTPIQTKAIPAILDGRDIVGTAQTGTGKTAAFTLPILQRLTATARRAGPTRTRVLVLTPTRELAAQINESVRDYGRNLRITSTVVFGGVSDRPQRQALQHGVDILVATPGRLLDLIQQRACKLDTVETLVLDEADQMLDIGFMPAIKRIIAMLPAKRQTLLFSATMPKEIRELAARHLTEPVEVSVAPAAATADRIDQHVMHLTRDGKTVALSALLRQRPGERAIVFTRTKRGADKVVRKLESDGLPAAAIHGNKSQGQRDRALSGFKDGSCPVLVATDIAARGIDVPDVALVINFELPNIPEVYIHRIGRTARAGAAGVAISLCEGEEREYLRDIERLIRRQIPVMPAVGGAQAAREGAVEPRREGRDGGHAGRRNGAGAANGHRPDSRRQGNGGRGNGQSRGQPQGRPRHADAGDRRRDDRLSDTRDVREVRDVRPVETRHDHADRAERRPASAPRRDDRAPRVAETAKPALPRFLTGQPRSGAGARPL